MKRKKASGRLPKTLFFIITEKGPDLQQQIRHQISQKLRLILVQADEGGVPASKTGWQ